MRSPCGDSFAPGCSGARDRHAGAVAVSAAPQLAKVELSWARVVLQRKRSQRILAYRVVRPGLVRLAC